MLTFAAKVASGVFSPTRLAVLAVLSAFAIGAPQAVAQKPAEPPSSTANHPGFPALKKKFRTVRDVTKACLSCHANAAKQIHKTKHWNWEVVNPNTGQKLGKKNVINNYYVSLGSNVSGCASCHISYGWKDDGFDFASEESVDCLVCHDTTGDYLYKKFHAERRDCLVCHDTFPKRSRRKRPSLSEMAQSVGPPGRHNCGTCHFRGAGGDAVKHGDMDSSLTSPDRRLDVHMDTDGLNFSCVTCHQTDQHAVTGSRYMTKATDTQGVNVPGGSRATCQSCHGMAPHEADTKLNQHTRKVACQTCHIPEFARGGLATKMWWDWSTAGNMDGDGKPLVMKDGDGRVVYVTEKGEFQWAENVVPEYVWFNGKVEYTLLGDKIDPKEPVSINRFVGGPDDPDSRIWPVKPFRGKQPYDAGNNTLAVLHLSGRDDDAFWRTFNWKKAIAAGMESVGAPFSGRSGFVETRMLWPITHMVAPAEDALGCEDCHSDNGRLKQVKGIYLPGRDFFGFLDTAALVILVLTIAGVGMHAAGRIYFSLKRGTTRHDD